MTSPSFILSRRRLMRLFATTPVALLLAACGGGAAPTPIVPATTAPPAPAATNTTAPAAPPPTATTPPPTSAPSATATTASVKPSGVTSAAPTPVAKPAAGAPSPILAATPSCADSDDLTPAQTEGPYYTPNTPQRASLLEPSMPGTKLLLSGRVLSTRCQPVSRALIDFWQADGGGQYDNAGFKLRGHQFSDAQGAWKLETVVPGLYPGRTRHIHVKVQAPSRPILTTQLYFPDEPGNARDGIFDQALVMSLKDVGGAKEATYDFVLNVG